MLSSINMKIVVFAMSDENMNVRFFLVLETFLSFYWGKLIIFTNFAILFMNYFLWILLQ